MTNLLNALATSLRTLATAAGHVQPGVTDPMHLTCGPVAEQVRAALEEHDRFVASGKTAHSLDGAELATILAALRYYQEQGMGDPDNRSDVLHGIATNDDREVSLDDEGIDALCEKLNAAS